MFVLQAQEQAPDPGQALYNQELDQGPDQDQDLVQDTDQDQELASFVFLIIYLLSKRKTLSSLQSKTHQSAILLTKD
mgnify:CR=1 FL=1